MALKKNVWFYIVSFFLCVQCTKEVKALLSPSSMPAISCKYRTLNEFILHLKTNGIYVPHDDLQ